MALKANTVCKNKNCHKGEDGGRKHYYACAYCAHEKKWRALACSEECYAEYLRQVHEARAKSEPVDTLPERTDMTREDVVELIHNTPDEVVEEMTRKELDGYLPEGTELSPETVSPALDVINAEIDAERQEKRKGKKNH